MQKKAIVLMTIFLFTIQSMMFSLALDNDAVQNLHSLSEGSDWVIGADVSYLDDMEDHGAVYKDMGSEKDALLILKDHWFNTIRLRLWHTPSNSYCTLDRTAAMVRRIKASGMKFLLDIHYSDSWADIVQQPKPALWQNCTFSVLQDSVYQYTRKVIQVLKDQDAMPDMVQIGNEIAHGMLWNDGRVGDAYHTPQQWKQFTDLIKAGIQGVKDNEDAGEPIEIMIHVHCGDNNGFSTWFYDNLISNGVEFDIIGLSFYTSWGSTWQQLQENMNALALRYNKDIIVAEIAYPWSLSDMDWFPNQVTELNQTQTGYNPSVNGQKRYLEDLISSVRNVPGNHGKGVIYYSPEYIPVSGVGSSWDNNTLFGPQGDLLTSVDAFAPAGIERITLRLNSASIPDTLGPDSFFEVRGSANGTAPASLQMGQVLDWDESSTIEPKNMEGDYFTATFFAPAQTRIQFKFWSEGMEKCGTNGWEAGNTGTNSAGDMLLTVTQDTTLPLHFFNGLGERKPYDWQPWESAENQTAVWFRVYMNTRDAVQKGYPSGEGNPVVGVRGDALSGNGPFDWGSTKVTLKRESDDTGSTGYHLFSGVAFYPESLSGSGQKFKFFIEPNGWENNPDRTFTVPEADTTLHWVYFSNSKPIKEQTGIMDETASEVDLFSLSANYPNPFNESTIIKFVLPQQSHVMLKVFDLLGRESATVAYGTFPSGEHSVELNGRHLTSGIYIYRIETGGFTKSKKLLLLK